MSKYSKYQRPSQEYKTSTHPIWRGIGCLMVIILPALSYFSALELVNTGLNKGWPIPRNLLGLVQFPEWVWKVSFLASVIRPIATFRNFYAVLLFTIVILIALTGILSLIYFIFFRLFGPPRLSSLDAPPIKSRKVRKSR